MKEYEGSNRDRYSKLLTTSDGGIILSFQSESITYGDYDISVFRTDTLGNIVWSTHLGTTKRDYLRALNKLESGYLVSGWTNEYGLIDDICLTLLDESGNKIKTKIYGTTNDDEVQSVTSLGNDLFAMIGMTLAFSDKENAKIFFSIFNSNLNMLKTVVYYKDGDILPRKIIHTSDNSFIIVANHYIQGEVKGVILKLNMNGEVVWDYEFGKDVRLRDIIESSDGTVFVVGSTTDSDLNAKDILFLKMNQNGELLFSRTVGGIKDDYGKSIIINDNKVIIVGETKSYGDPGFLKVCFLEFNVNGSFTSGYYYETEFESDWPEIVKSSDGYFISFDVQSDGSGENICLVKTDRDGKSCCSKKISKIILNEAPVMFESLNLTFSNKVFLEKERTFASENADYNSKYLCASPVHITGPDTLFCVDTAIYSVLPALPMNLIWAIPDSAVIINQDETSIVVDFNGQSGMIYLLSGSCPSDTLDSLFVTVFSGEIPEFNLGPDTTFCNGNHLRLTPGNNYQQYLWQEGTTDSVYTVITSGTYWVKVTDTSGCSATDSITVETYPAFDFDLGPDTTICYGDYIFLLGPEGYAQYLWQDGSDLTSYIAATSGLYWLEVTDTNNCIASDSLTLQVNKVESFLSPDTLMCKGENYIIRTHPQYEQYFWQDGSNDSIYTATQKGKYWVTVTDSIGCTGTDTLNLDYFPSMILQLNATGYLCEDDSVLLIAVSNYNNYLWQDSSRNSTYIVRDSGTYWVRVTSPCETKSDTIIIDACSSIWIPNVFTPNNDGYNDYFYAVGKNIPKFKMEIFNRWGQVLKTLNSINEKWDGTYKGQKMPQGTYFWVADYEQVNRDGSTEHIKLQGSVTLVR